MNCPMQRQLTMILLWSILIGKSSSSITGEGFSASFQLRRAVSSVVAFQTRSSPSSRSRGRDGIKFSGTLNRVKSPCTVEKNNAIQYPLSCYSSSRTFRSSLPPSMLEDDLEHIRRPAVQWYPGHIAKAERQLSETLKAVDVVVEVRDGRAPKATSHPRVGEWCAGRPRIVVLTHVDQLPKPAIASWKRAYDKFGAHDTDMDGFVNFAQVWNQAKQNKDERNRFAAPLSPKSRRGGSDVDSNKSESSDAAISPVEQVLFVDAKQGQGIHALHRAIFKAGSHVQERRERRGLKERALRVGIIGYPNVGKVCLRD